MAEVPYVRAPRPRQIAAGLVDAAAFGGLSRMARRREPGRSDGAIGHLLAGAPEVLRQQLRSPGQLLLGTRTVDRRTGARVALWRTLALVGSAAAGRELVRRLEVAPSPERTLAQKAHADEAHEIFRRHPQESPERQAALAELSARYPGSALGPGVARAMVPSLLVGLLNGRLRRRLAPTVEVLARGRRDHRP